MLGLIYRTFYVNASPSSLQKLYVCLVRPLLEYACQVGNPYLTKDIEKLKKVQNITLRLCFKQWHLDYSSLLFIAELPRSRLATSFYVTVSRKITKICDFSKAHEHSVLQDSQLATS